METGLREVFENGFYMLALLNPASKIMFLASYQPKLSRRRNFELSWKSSAAALLILVLLAAAGQIMLSRIFRVELYSLQITGGLVLFVIGWTAISKGRFIQRQQHALRNNLTDISLVPLAAPLIAGPGLIAAAIAGSVKDGLLPTCAALSVAGDCSRGNADGDYRTENLFQSLRLFFCRISLCSGFSRSGRNEANQLSGA